MSRAAIERDFLGLEKQSSENPPLERRRSFKGIQNAISRIHPQVLKNVITSSPAAGGFDARSSENCALPKHEAVYRQSVMQREPTPSMLFRSALPVFNPISRPFSQNQSDTAPLTIFYNGTVTVFDVSRDKADIIFKMAESGVIGKAEFAESKFAGSERRLLNEDLPLTRKHSLQRFFEKRKERLTALSPYAPTSEHAEKKAMESVAA